MATLRRDPVEFATSFPAGARVTAKPVAGAANSPPQLSDHATQPMADAAVDTLARIGEKAAPPLIEALGDPEPVVRLRAATALGRMGPAAHQATEALVRALDDPDERVRRAAMHALGQIGQQAEEAIDVLMERLRTVEPADQPPAANS